MRKPQMKAIIRTDKADKTGACPICIQILINGDKKRISIGEKINPINWDTSLGRAKGKGFANLNNVIDKRKSTLNEFFSQSILAGKLISSNDIDIFLKGFKNNDFYKVYDLVLQKKTELSVDTRYKYEVLRRRLKKFRPKISVSDIDNDFILQFDLFLKGLGIGEGGIYNHHKCLKSIINYAKIEKNISIDNPYHFKSVVVKSPEHRSTFLDTDEVIKIANYKTEDENDINARDMFLLACYTGLRYSDLYTLKLSHINFKTEVLSKVQVKTKEKLEVPLSQQAIDLLKIYSINKENDDKLFKEVSNQVGNRIIKKIAKECKIDKNVSFHVARHTFASYLSNGNHASVINISKLLGHKNIANTLVYTNTSINNLKKVMTNVHFG
ncbi:tyrosine-type recombinase/integrase [Chryseobacterium sp.]|uniref:tyrosine-type recombinase/integrase n=1 Tax=Chryseobacterium sp. TaxID=1871047 RepID=UPI00289A11A5|nr:tyrosine-type recombinase/integrase [Chryseobacterium sp.]